MRDALKKAFLEAAEKWVASGKIYFAEQVSKFISLSALKWEKESISVTRLGDFWNFKVINFLSKTAQILG